MKKSRRSMISKLLVFVALFTALLGCNMFSGDALLPTITPNPEASTPMSSTATSVDPSPPRIPTSEPSALAATELPTQTPFPTIIPEPVRGCIPHPEQAFAPWGGSVMDSYYWAFCDGKFHNNVPAPVKGHLWDYTPLTGRLAYGSPTSEDLGSSDLRIYDYRSGKSEPWLEGNVIGAKWSPVKDKHGVQHLLVLVGTYSPERDEHPKGDLYLMASRDDLKHIVSDVCCVAWSPTGDRITYVENGTVFALNPFAPSPRMLGKPAYGQPAWAIEQEAVIFPSWPIKIAGAYGSGDFVPMTSTGEEIYGSKATSMLWSPKQRRLAFRKELDQLCNALQCPDLGDVYWVYQFSEDLKIIEE